jgi:hypothetical protein
MGSPRPRVGGTWTLSIAPSEPAHDAEERCNPVARPERRAGEATCRIGSPRVRQRGTSCRNPVRAIHWIMSKVLANI